MPTKPATDSQQSSDLPSIVDAAVNATPIRPPALAVQLGVLAHYSDGPMTDDAGIITTLDLRDPMAQVELQQALAGDSESLWDVKPDHIIRVEHVVRHYAEAQDEETGEIRSGPMLTLIGPDGVYHTMSKYAFRSFQLIAHLRGAPPWRPPIMIRAVKPTSRNKRQYQSVQLVE